MVMQGILTNPDIKELRKPWADPIVRENIMYVPFSAVRQARLMPCSGTPAICY